METHRPILVVDDTCSVRTALTRALRLARYSVLAAGHVQEALELLSSSEDHPGLIISDLEMPGLSVETLIAHARRLQPPVPMLLISGSGDLPGVRQIVARAGLPFLAKPFTLDELIASVQRLTGEAPA